MFGEVVCEIIGTGLKITLYPEFRGCRMLCIFIKNHLCSRRRNTYLDHELFYNNVVRSFIQSPMVEEILMMQQRQKKIFFSLTELRCELIRHYSLMRCEYQCMLGTANDQSCIYNKF